MANKIQSAERIKQILVVAATILVIVFNWLANALPLGGRTTGEVSDKFDNLLTPAGYAFSIWGLIYAGLLAFSVFQVLPAQTDNPRLRRIRSLYILNCAANCCWLYCWHNEFLAASVGVMLVLLGTLILIHQNLEIGKTVVSKLETWTTRIPFSIYFGWITVATILNLTIALLFVKFDGAGVSPFVWAVILIIAAAAIALTIAARFGNAAFALAVAWGLAAIAVKQQSNNSNVMIAAAVAALVAAVLPPILFLRK